MRTLAIAVAVLAVLTALPAQAQMGGGKRQRSDDASPTRRKPQIDEKATRRRSNESRSPRKNTIRGAARVREPDKKKPK